MTSPDEQLKLLNTTRTDPDLFESLGSLSTSLVMGTEAYLRSFNVKEGITKITQLIEHFCSAKSYGDTMVMGFRSLALIFELGPSSHTVCHKLHGTIVELASSAIHSTLCFEWRHVNTDSTMMLEEGLRVIKFVALADLSGKMIQHVLVGDLLTLCANTGDALVTRSALETLHALCSKVVLPSELDTGIVNTLLSFFGASPTSPTGKGPKSSSHPIVIAVEKIISPFLLTMVEQLSENISSTAADHWSYLELILQCLGRLMDRSLLCHRHSTGNAIASSDLPKLLFMLILKTEQNALLEPNTRSQRMLLCETVLSSVAACNRELVADVLIQQEAKVFFTNLLNQSVADSSTLLDNPFSSNLSVSSTSQKKRRDSDHIPFIAGIRLIQLACPNIPSAAFGLRPELLMPIHCWQWEDELHQFHNFSEEHCAALECAYARLDHTYELIVSKRTEDIDLQAMIIRKGSREMYRNMDRKYTPCAFQYVEESMLRPVQKVKETGPDAKGFYSPPASQKFSSPTSDIVNIEAVVTKKNIALAEMYLEMLAVFAAKGLGTVARLLSICTCASLLHTLLISKDKKTLKLIIKRTMIPLCAMLGEALLHIDSVSNSIALTMIKWLFSREDDMKWYFSVTFQRCGLLRKLECLGQPSEVPSKKNSSSRKAIQKLSKELYIAINEKLARRRRTNSLGQVEIDKIEDAVNQLRGCSETPGVHDTIVDLFFDAVSSETVFTVYEAFQMKIAAAILSYLLHGKTLNDLIGKSLIYSSEGYASTNAGTTTIQSNFFAAEDGGAASFVDGMQTCDFVFKHVDEMRLSHFVGSGLRHKTGFQKVIQLLAATLSLDLPLPLVECLVSSEKITCKNPVGVFTSMTEISPYVRLCTPRTRSSSNEQGITPTSNSMSSTIASERSKQLLHASRVEEGTQEKVGEVKASGSEQERTELRAHLMASIGDVERLLRTGNASNKNTYIAPTTQSALQNIDFFLRRVEVFLQEVAHSKCTRESTVALNLLKSREEKNNVLLPTLVHNALAKFYTRGSLPRKLIGVPATEELMSSLIAKRDRDVANKLILNALDERFSLYRQFSGPCSFQATFFSVLFTEAFNTRNKKTLIQLEKMLVSFDETRTTAGHGGPLASPPLSTRSSITRSDRFPLPTPSDHETLSNSGEMNNTDVNKFQRYTFHFFEGKHATECNCGKLTREFLGSDRRNEFSIQFPPIAYREDITVLAIIHNYLSAHKKLNEIAFEETGSDIFVSSSLTTLVLRSAAKSALRVALLPGKFALPRWVNFVFANAKFLLPLSVREKLCRFIAYGARRSLIKCLRRQGHLRTGVGNTVSELAKLSNHKYLVNREKLLDDSLRVLRKASDYRLPVSIEFKGDIGVGQGPTAQFYTLLSREIMKKSMALWNRVTPEECKAGSADGLMVPPPEGLYPLPTRDSLIATDQAGKTTNKRLVTDRVRKAVSDAVLCFREKTNVYYTVGIALGRVFLDGHVLPLHFSNALFELLRRGVPSFQVSLHDTEREKGIHAPIDLFYLNEDHVSMVDKSVAASLRMLSCCDKDTLESLQIPFTLPGDDNFELIENGSKTFVNVHNIGLYRRRVAAAILYESVAVPIRLITAGFCDVVPRESLAVLDVPEISRLLCGESRGPLEPLWTYDEIRAVLVGDHGYQNDSPQLDMLAEVLSQRLNPMQQQSFLFFATGCPRLPLGGICALGAITVVKRGEALIHALDLSQTDIQPDPSMEVENSSNYSSSSGGGINQGAQFTLNEYTEESILCIAEKEWALPSVNTCFRYLKLPPYPNVELMHKKLLLSITQSGDAFELS